MKKRENRGFTASFDMLGEAARTFPDAERYYRSYEDAIRAVGKVAERGPFDLGEAVGAAPALRGRAVRSLRARADRAGRGAGDAGGEARHPLHHRRRGDRAAGDEPRHHRGGRRPAGAQGLGRARHGDPGLWQARPADRRLGRCARREDRPADRGAAGQGRLLGHRDQAHPGAGPRPIIPCSRARRRPTSPTSPARRTCWRRRTSIQPSPPTMR